METNDYQNKLMQHTCGLSNGEKRNFFGTSFGCKDSDEFEALVVGGYAVSRDPASWMGDDVIYCLTEKGKARAAETMPKPEISKLTRSQERYQRFLEYGDGFDSFLHFLSWDAEPERSWN